MCISCEKCAIILAVQSDISSVIFYTSEQWMTHCDWVVQSQKKNTKELSMSLLLFKVIRTPWQIFTTRCTLVQSAVLWSHVVCLSVRPSVSVCLSVTLVDCDHIGWNTSEIISPVVSSPGMFTLCNPNTPIFGPKVTHPPVDLSVGDIRSQIAAEWLQIAQWSQWRAYRNLPSLFLMVPSLTPYDLPFPQN